MKAVGVFARERAVRLIDAPVPVLHPGNVMVRTLAVGVCGTDKEIARFEYGQPPEGSDYLILGHECLAEIVETGELVIPMVRRPCPHLDCRACRASHQDFCYTGDFTERGINGVHGFMAEYFADEPRFLFPVPKELRETAVLTEPLTIVEKAFSQLLEIQERLPWQSPATGSEPPLTGLKGLVLGAGPVGLLGAMKLRAAGCEVTVYSREDAESPQAKLAVRIGAKYVSGAQTPLTEIGTFDVVFEATGASKLAFDALPVLDDNAVFVFTGIPGQKFMAEVPTGDIMRKLVLRNQVVLGTVNAGRSAYEAAVRDLGVFERLWPGTLGAMISTQVSIDHFCDFDLQHLAGIKTIITVA